MERKKGGHGHLLTIDSSGLDGSPLARYIYTSMSCRTNETRSSTGARTFGYDLTGQLLQVTHPGGEDGFFYTIGGGKSAGEVSASAANFRA